MSHFDRLNLPMADFDDDKYQALYDAIGDILIGSKIAPLRIDGNDDSCIIARFPDVASYNLEDLTTPEEIASFVETHKDTIIAIWEQANGTDLPPDDGTRNIHLAQAAMRWACFAGRTWINNQQGFND